MLCVLEIFSVCLCNKTAVVTMNVVEIFSRHAYITCLWAAQDELEEACVQDFNLIGLSERDVVVVSPIAFLNI